MLNLQFTSRALASPVFILLAALSLPISQALHAEDEHSPLQQSRLLHVEQDLSDEKESMKNDNARLNVQALFSSVRRASHIIIDTSTTLKLQYVSVEADKNRPNRFFYDANQLRFKWIKKF